MIRLAVCTAGASSFRDVFFYHVAGVVAVFRYVFRDPKVDVRLLAFGALLPNLIDKPLALLAPQLGSDRLLGHSLVFSSAVMVAALLVTRRGRRRRAWMAVAIGAMIHLVLDGMWTAGQTFLWPFLGWAFAPGPILEPWLNWPLVAAQEAAGIAYLAVLWRRFGLSDRHHQFWATGRLR